MVWNEGVSYVVIKVALEMNENIFADASLLHPAGDTKDINMAKLDAMIKGVNLALQWQVSLLHHMMDSVYVHHWILNTLTNKAWINMKGLGEILARW